MKLTNFIEKSAFLVFGILFGLFLTITFDVTDFVEAENSNPPLEVTKLQESNVSEVVVSAQVMSKAFVEISQKLTPAIATVKSEKLVKISEEDSKLFNRFNMPFDGYNESGVGSGIVIDPKGYILTNYHVVDNADKITVKLTDRREFEATIIGSDQLTDIAVIKIEGENLPIAPIGDSDSINVGEWVLAIGTPLDLTSTVTTGIVSALNRDLNIMRDSYSIETFIQTDAAINPGNSGGGLINLKGEVIGMNTAIASRTGTFEGYGFAIPINLAIRVAKDLVDFGEVKRGYLGVMISEVTDEVAKNVGLKYPTGVLIGAVMEGKAADQAGLEKGDIILEVNGKMLSQPNALQGVVGIKRPGETISVKINRNGKEKLFDVTLQEIKREREVARVTERTDRIEGLGIKVRDLNENLAELYEFEEITQGVLVTDIDYFSPARRVGMETEELITRVGKTKVETVAEFRAALEAQKDYPYIIFHLKNKFGIVRVVEIENWQKN